MKLFLTLILFCFLAAADAAAEHAFDGFELYYASRPGAIFHASDKKAFRTDTDEMQRLQYVWQGTISGKKRSIVLSSDSFTIDGHHIPQAEARRFTSEVPGELGASTDLYVNESYVCIDGVAGSAAGSAVRHKQIYLLIEPFSITPRLFQLPGLFGSCTGLRLDEEKHIRFDEVKYRYAKGHDEAVGVIFSEFKIERGAFVDTNRRVSATFVEPENVYKFSLDP